MKCHVSSFLTRAQGAHLPGNFTLRWLPAYSPFLNIVEQCFAQWKAAVKRDFANLRDQLNAQPPAQRMATLAQIAVQNVGIIATCNATYLTACF